MYVCVYKYVYVYVYVYVYIYMYNACKSGFTHMYDLLRNHTPKTWSDFSLWSPRPNFSPMPNQTIALAEAIPKSKSFQS